jgi:hypothetical protein
VAALLLAFVTPSARAQSVCTAPIMPIGGDASGCLSGCTLAGTGWQRAYDGSDVNGFVSSTQVNPWLMLDLGDASTEVVHVFIIGGTTLLNSRNLALAVSNSSTYQASGNALCASDVGQTAAKQFFTVTCAAGAVGRYLFISSTISTSRTLSAIEVTVYEKGGYWHACAPPADRYLLGTVCCMSQHLCRCWTKAHARTCHA